MLEQQRAKTDRISKDDLDELDKAFQESATHTETAEPSTKKKSRDALLQQLKQKRDAGELAPAQSEAKPLDSAKQQGKFKPIGFKPIGSSTKKRKEGGGEEKKKKKRKVEGTTADETSKSAPAPNGPEPTQKTASTPALQVHEPESLDDDFDIFAGAGEYAVIDIDEDEDEGGSAQPKLTHDKTDVEEGEVAAPAPRRGWFDDEEREPILPPKPADDQIQAPKISAVATSIQPAQSDEEMEDDRPMRLAGLESSTVPSIKDLLEMDDAAARYEKQQKRKEKKKKKAKGDDEDD